MFNGRRRIVESAIELFGADGIAATSLRAVASRAGVSPALVVHHFGSKAGLRRAVEEEVVARFESAFAAEDPTLEGRARATQAILGGSPAVSDYVGRALAEGGDAAARLFDELVELGLHDVARLRDAGAIRPDADAQWLVLHHVLLLFGPLMLRGHVERVLGESLLEPRAFARWARATEALLRHGWYVDPE